MKRKEDKKIRGGFVVNTDEGTGEVSFHVNNYLRMGKMSANYPVIRLRLGRVSGNDRINTQNYLTKLDSLVQLVKNVSIKTVFKMTLHGAKQISWKKLLKNKNKAQQHYIEAEN